MLRCLGRSRFAAVPTPGLAGRPPIRKQLRRFRAAAPSPCTFSAKLFEDCGVSRGATWGFPNNFGDFEQRHRRRARFERSCLKIRMSPAIRIGKVAGSGGLCTTHQRAWPCMCSRAPGHTAISPERPRSPGLRIQTHGNHLYTISVQDDEEPSAGPALHKSK